jgi:4-hydroxy-tetrahydrodipicolinate synthase
MNYETAFRGTGVALVTPFKTDGNLDLEAHARLLDFTIDGGVDYLVVNGTTGESVTTSTVERKQLLLATLEQVNRRVPIVYGIGGNHTSAILETIRNFDFTGISAILSVSPYYNKPSQEAIYQHYIILADACPVPVILYNVPGRTGSNISAATTVRLAQHPNIIGIKEASGNLTQCMHIVRDKPAGFLVISGEDLLTVPMASFGMDGVISVLANAFPEEFCRMTKLALEGNFAEAGKLSLKFLNLDPLMYEESNPVGVKAALEIKGICSRFVRQPLLPASEELVKKIQISMEDLK